MDVNSRRNIGNKLFSRKLVQAPWNCGIFKDNRDINATIKLWCNMMQVLRIKFNNADPKSTQAFSKLQCCCFPVEPSKYIHLVPLGRLRVVFPWLISAYLSYLSCFQSPVTDSIRQLRPSQYSEWLNAPTIFGQEPSVHCSGGWSSAPQQLCPAMMEGALTWNWEMLKEILHQLKCGSNWAMQTISYSINYGNTVAWQLFSQVTDYDKDNQFQPHIRLVGIFITQHSINNGGDFDVWLESW